MMRKSPTQNLMQSTVAVVLLSLLLLLLLTTSASSSSSSSSSIFVSACNTTYCNNRGNGSATTTNTPPDNCTCACEYPYFGYRCRYEFAANNVSVVVDCGTRFSSDSALCNGSSQCQWNNETSTCVSKVLPPYANDQPTGELVASPWCYRMLPLPLEFTIYCFATAAFGVGGIGFFYMMRYCNTYSIVEENGERMFNEFYDNHWLTTLYCFLLFASAGMLAVSAYVNFRDPSVCVYVIFFFAYIIIQAMVIFYPIKWTVQFLYKRYSSPEKKKLDLDAYIRPTNYEIQKDRKGCQMRCF